MPPLRVLAGSSPNKVVPIAANSSVPVKISSDVFEGQIAVYIKGFAYTEGKVGDNEYFRRRTGVTWSIQVQGTYAHPYFGPHGRKGGALAGQVLTQYPSTREVFEGVRCR